MTTFSPSTRPRHARNALLSAVLIGVFASALTLLGGCGGEVGEDTVIATVADREVTAGYFEEKLAKLKVEELPRDEAGTTLDMATLEGKKAFLEVIINKELMAAKAQQLGFESDPDVVQLSDAMGTVHASEVMHRELVEKDARVVTDEEIRQYYDRASRTRTFRYLITNFESDALAAREALMGGADWEDVIIEYNDGSSGPTGDFRLSLAFGRTSDEFEEPLFSLTEGEISRPIETVYGYWVAQLEKEEITELPPLDIAYSERIKNTLVARKVNLARSTFLKESRRKHEYKMDEAALWIIFNAMPDQEDMLDLETNQPVPREELAPLEIDSKDLGKFFLSFKPDLDEEPEVWTIGDYKTHYERQSVFQRPKKATMLGGVRDKIITQIVNRPLLLAEARERGFMGHPDVRKTVDEKMEQILVQKIHDEIITIDEDVTAEQLDAWWAENKELFKEDESRDLHIVYCAEREQAEQALAAIQGGAVWADVLAEYGANPDNRKKGGVFEGMTMEMGGNIADSIFALEKPGELTGVIEVVNGFAVARLDTINPGRQPEFAEMTNSVARAIKRERKDVALDAKLTEWRQEFPIVIHEDRLAKLRSWQELQEQS